MKTQNRPGNILLNPRIFVDYSCVTEKFCCKKKNTDKTEVGSQNIKSIGLIRLGYMGESYIKEHVVY